MRNLGAISKVFSRKLQKHDHAFSTKRSLSLPNGFSLFPSAFDTFKGSFNILFLGSLSGTEGVEKNSSTLKHSYLT